MEEKYTHTLDLNLIPHKVIREKKKITIEVKQEDIPNHVLPNLGPGYSYHVIGILAEEKCYKDGVLYEGEPGYSKILGLKYRFGFHNKVSLHILN